MVPRPEEGHQGVVSLFFRRSYDGRLQEDVGGDAHRLDAVIPGRQVLCDGQLQLTLVLVPIQVLDRALAEGSLPDDDSPVTDEGSEGQFIGGLMVNLSF